MDEDLLGTEEYIHWERKVPVKTTVHRVRLTDHPSTARAEPAYPIAVLSYRA